MTKPNVNTVNFLSYNSTGLDSLKTKWIRDLLETCNATFCGLQEHFKRVKTLPRLFRTAFPNYDNFALPAHREEGRDTGRAQGGLAQLMLKGCEVRRQVVPNGGWRLQAQILHFDDWKILWVNCYFPTDPRIINFDEEELLAVQAELESVLEKGGYDGVVAGGDWNYDARRTSGFARSMATFLDKVGLVSVWEKFPIDFTYMHHDHKSCSILDNFYVNAELLPYIEEAGPIHLGDNPSGHSPVLLKLKLSHPPKSNIQECVRVPRRLQWSKADEADIKKFSKHIQERLEVLADPECLSCLDVKCNNEEHSRTRDSYVMDLMSILIEAGYATIPVAQPRPKKQGKGGQCLPGWKETCEPLSKDAKFWYQVWLSAGRPPSGELHRVMVNCRVKFRAAVRRAKSDVNSQKGRVLLQAAESGNTALLQEMKKVLGPRNDPQQLPDSFEGEVGHEEILEKFRGLYSCLYNSAGTQEMMDELLEKVESQMDCRSEVEVAKVTGKVVQQAVLRMKPGKVDVSTGYSSDSLLHGPPILFEKLAAVFRSFLVHGSITLTILACSLMPLLKSARKDPSQFDSYRAVAGASQMLKLFEYVILILWGHHLDSDSLQFGFKPGTGTDQCSWLLLSVAEYYLHRGSPTLCCLLDVKKGFPSVQFGPLFKICLEEKKLPAVVCRVLMFMYMHQSGFIKLKGRQSRAFAFSNGMREGAAASPVLWAVYADGMIKRLRKSGLGCYIAGCWVGAVFYADDLALIAPTRAILAAMLDLVVGYGASLNLKFSSSQDPKKCKSFCLFFTGRTTSRRVVYPASLVLDGVKLPWKEKAVHLGHTLHQDLTMDADAKEKRARFIARSVDVRGQFAFAAPPQILRAVQVLACDAYGSMLWRLDSPAASSFFSAHTSCVKRIYRLPLNTFTYLVEGHLGERTVPLRVQVLCRVPKFYRGLLGSPSKEVQLLAELATNDARTVLACNVAFVSKLSGLNCKVESAVSVRCALPIKTVPERESWRLGLLDILLRRRADLERQQSDTKRVIALISSLCAT